MFHQVLKIVRVLFVISVFLKSSKFVSALNVLEKTSYNSFADIKLYNDTGKNTKSIFVYRNNGVRLNIRLVSSVNDSNREEEDDQFPMPPIWKLIQCIVNVSKVCIKTRIANYIDTVGRLDKIILFGKTVKLVKIRELPKGISDRQRRDSVSDIDRSIDDFFDKFALRITLTKWNGRNEENQMDFMFDSSDLIEGRGKGGDGGSKGRKCKQMLMCMMMALKMNMLGMMALMMMKGMMMNSMFWMMTKAMLIMKFIDSKRSTNTDGQIKKIIILTRGSSSSDCVSCHGPPPHSSYGVPPSSSSEHHGSW